MKRLSPAEHGRHLAKSVTITDEQALEFARILVSVRNEDCSHVHGERRCAE